MSERPIGRVRVTPTPNPKDFLASDQHPVDIRIYLSPKAVGIAVFVVALVFRLVETTMIVVADHL
jgi:hypothetical protein